MKPQSFQLSGHDHMPDIFDLPKLNDNSILNLLPMAVYVCNESGVIFNYNQRAVEFWGRTPVKGDKDEKFCGAYKLYYPDGRYMPHHETPVALCLKTGEGCTNQEVVIEKPDHSRIVVKVNIAPILDNKNNVQGVINCFMDITNERQIQKALDNKTKELQDYVDNATIALHWVDAEGKIKWANKTELDMLGYSDHEYIGHPISEFYQDKEIAHDVLQRLKSNESLKNYEATLRCKDGSLKTVSISSNVFWDEGKFVHTRCFTVDITGQKQLYAALKQSETRYKTLVEGLPAAVYTCDKDGWINFYNEQAVQLWGYRPNISDDSVRFCAFYKVWMMNGDFVNPEKTPMAIALQTGKSFQNLEVMMERNDGSKFYAVVNIDPLYDEDNNVIGAINIFQDITSLKQIEIALRESEARYRKLIHSLETPLYTTDVEGRITLYNRAAVALWGREPEIGKDLWCGSYKIFNTDGSNLPLEECPMAVCLKEHRPVFGEEILVVRPDGTLRNVAPHPQPIYDEAGNMIGAINMLVDITDMKKTEQALKESEKRYRELAASLELKVEEKTLQMKEYTSQLEFQNKELEQFAYAASHDLKEPLRKIQLYNSSISENTSNHLDEKSKDYLNRSVKAAKRMSDLIEDLLTYSKTTMNTESFEEVNIHEIMEEITLMHKEDIEQNNVRIESDQLPMINAVPFQIKQLMFNLINNSIKYKHPERSVYIRTKSKIIKGDAIHDEQADPMKSYHHISIEDNGIGFNSEYGEKIFNIFQRLNNKSGTKGSGIGLAICKRIVQNHHGFIHASGWENEGARFDLYLPTE